MLPAAPRRLRVALDAHTVGRRQTGNERYVVELGRELALSPDVELLAYLDAGVEPPADWHAHAAAVALRRLTFRQPQLRIPFELPVRTRRDRADLLHVSYVAPPIAGVPLVTTVHDLSFEDEPQFFRLPNRLRLQSLVRLSAQRSAAVITGSEFTRGRLLAVYGLPPERVHAIPYGVSERWRIPTAAEVQARLGPLAARLPERFVLAVGTAHPRKNRARLVEALRLLRQGSEADVGLVLAGPDREALSEPWITQLGFVSDDVLQALYARAAAVACVSLYEGFGLPVLEALACGALVVASATTATAEVAGTAALTVDPQDVDSIAAGLRGALQMGEAARREMRAAATQQLARFSWRECAAAHVAVYRQVVGRG